MQLSRKPFILIVIALFQVCTATEDDLDSPAIQSSYRNLTCDIWSHPNFSNKTPLLKQLQDVILQMVQSDCPSFLNFAFMTSIWGITIMANPKQQYSFCRFTKVINSSVNYYNQHDKEDFDQSIREHLNVSVDTCSLLTYEAGRNVGCKNLQTPQIPPKNCYENGLVFLYKPFWAHYGSMMPCALADVFCKLYESKNYQERAFAAAIAFSLTPQHELVIRPHPKELIIETAQLYVQSKNPTQCKCPNYISRMTTLCEGHCKYKGENIEMILEELHKEPNQEHP